MELPTEDFGDFWSAYNTPSRSVLEGCQYRPVVETEREEVFLMNENSPNLSPIFVD